MNRKRLSLSTTLAFAGVLAAGSIAVAQDDVMYSGCIDGDANLVNVAVGAEPAGPCDKSMVLAQWNATGPVGPRGEQGEQGAQGDQGDKGKKGDQGPPGVNKTYIVTKSTSASVAVSLQAKCDEGDLATGGGFRKNAGPSTDVIEDFPSGSRAWNVSLVANNGSLTNIELDVFVTCSDLEPLRS